MDKFHGILDAYLVMFSTCLTSGTNLVNISAVCLTNESLWQLQILFGKKKMECLYCENGFTYKYTPKIQVLILAERICYPAHNQVISWKQKTSGLYIQLLSVVTIFNASYIRVYIATNMLQCTRIPAVVLTVNIELTLFFVLTG